MWLKALISLLMIQYLAATCNVCQSASKVACHNETTFSICYDGEPSYDLLSCPKNFYCTDGFYTCYQNADPVCKSEEDTTTTEILTTTTTDIPTTTTTEIPTTTTTEIPTTTTTEIPTTTTTKGPWNADDICQQATKSTSYENEDDPSCTTFIKCTVSTDGTHSTKITSCPTNQYFSTSLKVCTATKPDGCVEVTTKAATTTVATTTTAKTTVTTTTAATTTAEPWSAEATCLTITKSTLFQNKDDPTCTSYLYCYVSNGSATALIKKCPTNEYFDISSKVCGATKPDYCT
ncbi:probable endochitinase [Drosophila rhopaloa]|uniref:Probable endochitinase n=1 Tax=Drosophila rhopaloa TaxID=1041015 RepID=A0A6P4E601_DRORH|nr:probable endochitinase [Drosophila rhopaloa]